MPKDTTHDFYLYSQGAQEKGSHPKPAKPKSSARTKEKKQLEGLRKRGEKRQETGLA